MAKSTAKPLVVRPTPRRVIRRPAQVVNPVPPFVKSISVRELYGRFDYPHIEFSGLISESSKVGIIYGDNGTGKSTLLRLVYSCLSPNSKEGLRTYLSLTPFSALNIELVSGHRISIRRVSSRLVGSYSFTITHAGKRSVFSIKAERNLLVSPQDSTRKLEKALTALGLSIIYVDHSRRIRSTPNFFSEHISGFEDEDAWARSRASSKDQGQPDDIYKDPERSLPFPLDQITLQFSQWLRVLAIRRGYTGDIDASQVYLDVVKGLTQRRSRKVKDIYPDKAALAGSIKSLESQAQPYIRHGLASEFPFSGLADLVEAAPESRTQTISAILGPFLDSIRKRLDALRDVQDLISSFETEVNGYMRDKRASVNILEGLSLNIGSDSVDLESLSSGEQQLLFLFCTAILSRDKRRLIIIDEPEISLNYNWQRKFVGSLQRISSSADTQFLFATHSIEIISRHEESAVELV